MIVPNYFWKCLIIMMFVHEARMIYETYMDYRDDDEEEMEDIIGDCHRSFSSEKLCTVERSLSFHRVCPQKP